MRTHTFTALILITCATHALADPQIGPDPARRVYQLGPLTPAQQRPVIYYQSPTAPAPDLTPKPPLEPELEPFPPAPVREGVSVESVAELRILGGKIENISFKPGWKRFLRVRVLQGVGDTDAMVDEDGTSYHIKNLPGIRQTPDDSYVSFYARRCDVLYDYTTVTGARRRVASYDVVDAFPPTAEIQSRYLERKAVAEKNHQAQLLAWKHQVEQVEARREITLRNYKRARDEYERKVDQIKREQEELARDKAARIAASQLRNASNGFGYAQYEIGLRYLKGDGVQQDRALAIHWLCAACTNGSSQASNKLATLQGVTSN
jgi:hypothetical protein